MDDRIPPQDIEMENALLGAMLLEERAVDEARAVVPVEAFYREANRIVYAALCGLRDDRQPIDPITVEARLRDEEHLDVIGGRPHLFTLMNSVPSTANAGYYAGRVARAWTRREVAKAGRLIAQMAHDADVEDPCAEADRILRKHTERNDRAPASHIGQVAGRVLADVRTRMETGQWMVGMATGIHDLDLATAGLEDGNLTIIGGRPGMGKSALASQIAWHIGKLYGPVLIANGEMSEKQLAQRMLASEAMVDLQSVRTASLTDEEFRRLETAQQRMERIPIRLKCESGLTVEAIGAEARAMAGRDGLRLLVVDYLQLLYTQSKRDSTRAEELARMADAIKGIGQDLKCHVILLSQLNRGLERRPSKRPTQSDLNESGGIEASGDIILMCYRPHWYTRQECGTPLPEPEPMELVLEKQRQGPTGCIDLMFDARHARFCRVVKEGSPDDPFA